MNYEEFRCWRDRAAGQKPALRLDCLNPAKALDHLTANRSHAPVAAPHVRLCELWHAAIGLDLDVERLVLGSGVRDLLRELFDTLSRPGRTFWLPADVYPVYWELLGDRTARRFATVPMFDLSFLDRTASSDCVLLPSPLSPPGRSFTARECERLSEWLAAGSHRHLILDGVYNFAFPIRNEQLAALMTATRCISLFSTSKSWLSPQVSGVAIVPPAIKRELESRRTPPGEPQQRAAMQLFAHEPGFPARLQRRFEQQWQWLTPRILQVAPGWQPPETGYFSTIRVASQTLWDEHAILTVPASVFGSDDTNLSVITCLYDIKAHDLATPP